MKTKNKIATQGWSLSKALNEWENLSTTLGPAHPAWQFRPTAIHRSNARYLAAAIHYATNKKAMLPRAAMQSLCDSAQLSAFLSLPVDTLAAGAKSAFLTQSMAKASDTENKAMPSGAARKSANNVASSCRRFLLFYRSFPQAEDQVKGPSLWPMFSISAHPEFNKAKDARFLYNHIRGYHELRGVLDPNCATVVTVRASVQDMIERAERTRTGRTYNKYLRALIAVCAGGGLPPNVAKIVETLSPIVSARKKRPDNTMAESLMIEIFPADFFPDVAKPGKFDRHLGLPGFFNKLAEAPRPSNQQNKLCEYEHLLGIKALRLRLAILRRYLAVTGDGSPTPQAFNARLSPDRVAEYIFSRVKEVGQPNMTIKTEYGHLIAIAKYYCGYDVGKAVKKIKLEIRFPSYKESAKGEIACNKGGVRDLMALADALAAYAAMASWLDSKGAWDKPGAGRYLARKSAEIDLRIRIETGFRPGVCDFLVLVDAPGDSTDYPVIWRSGNVYKIKVPWKFMKQHSAMFMTKKELAEFNMAESGVITKCYYFVVAHPLAVAAIDEYRERGWRHARSIKAKETRRLLLNSEGMPFYHDDESINSPSTLLNSAAREAADFVRRSTGKEVVCFDRYQHRHIMGSALEKHHPGHGLKRAYLTHTSDHGTDWVYGTQDNSLLQACMAELLAGLPPRADQAILREEEKNQQIRSLHEKIDSLVRLLNPENAEKKGGASTPSRSGAS